MSISDQLTPRERQIRETLAGIRPGLPESDVDPMGVESLGPVTSRRAAQVARNVTAFWLCPRCRARVPGAGGTCPECEFDTAMLDREGRYHG